MHAVFSLLAHQPILLLVVLLMLGTALGEVRIKGIQIGPAAVLFAAIGVSAAAKAFGSPIEVPEVVGTLGLVLFTYTVGVISGPNFFASLRRGWGPLLSMVGGFLVAALAAMGLGRLLGLSHPVIAGSFAGALTNTPALAAATHRSGDAAGPTIGYSITYIFGVVGMLALSSLVLRRRHSDKDETEPVINTTIRVDVDTQPYISELTARYRHHVTFSRMAHSSTAPIHVPEADDALRKHDLVVAVGPKRWVEQVVEELGHVSSHKLPADRRALDFRRITLSNRALAGRTLGEIDLPGAFGAVTTRVRRGDLDLHATDDFVLQMGDRLRIIGAADKLKEVSRHLGDSERGLSDINPQGLALGLAAGVLLGLIHVPLPGGGFALGAAGGTLLAGLVCGRLGRVGPVVVSMSHSAASALSTFGMLTFLAYAGAKAGQGFVAAVTSSAGWRIALVGAVVTLLAGGVLAAAARWLHLTGAVQTAGMLAGAQTQPALLAFSNEHTGHDSRVGIGYVLVYPAAMIAKIVIAQVLAGLTF